MEMVITRVALVLRREGENGVKSRLFLILHEIAGLRKVELIVDRGMGSVEKFMCCVLGCWVSIPHLLTGWTFSKRCLRISCSAECSIRTLDCSLAWRHRGST